MNLIPEQRADKNGKLVTRHVRNGPAAPPSAGSIPAPSLTTPKAKKAATPKPKTVQKDHVSVESRYADERLKKVYPYAVFHFTCSDAEAYDVMSVTDSSHTALRLLGAGVRSKKEASAFLASHGLSDLEQDHSGVVEELIRRGIPAIPGLLSMTRFGLYRKDQPNFYDAVEANSVRALREATGSAIDIPHMVWMGEVSLSDVRAVGATRIAAAERNHMYVVDRLNKVHEGKSPYDIATLKRLVVLAEEHSYVTDTLTMADSYGADFVLDLKDLTAAHGMGYALRGAGYSLEQDIELLRLNDDIRSAGKYLGVEDLRIAYDAGVTATDAIEGLDNGLEMSQVAALKEGIQSSIVSGWL